MNLLRDTRWNRLPALAPGLTFIAAWIALLEVAARSGWTNRAFSPVPSEVGGRLWNVLVSPGALLDAIGATVGLLAAGYLIACVIGVLCGLIMGYSRGVHALLEPTLELLRPIPKPALLPPLILLLGLGAPMKIAIVFLGALFPVLINTVQGVRTVDPVLVDVARTFRIGPLRTIFTVMLPASLPMILSGMRVSLGLGLVLVTLAEMLTGSYGLGAQLVDAQRAFRVHEMYAWTVVLALVGLALALGFNALERRLIFWSSRR
jgi:ABC-type nitrate/sulfonate/bicarbonate transport system permease component